MTVKYWKNELLRYFYEFLNEHPFSQTFQVIVVDILAVSLIDYYDIPSKLIAILPLPVFLLVSSATVMLIISWLLGLHVLDLFKITSFNVIDRTCVALLCTVPVWFIVQSFWSAYQFYKD